MMKRLGRFKLRRPGDSWIRPRRGPLGYVECAGWLARDLLWVDGWFTSADHEPVSVTLRVNGVEKEVVAERFCHSRLDLEEIPGAAGQILVLPAPDLTGEPPFIHALCIRQKDSWYRWTPRGGLAIQADLVTRLQTKVETLLPEVRQAFRSFLFERCPEVFSLGIGSDTLFRRNSSAAERLLGDEERAGAVPEETPHGEPQADEERHGEPQTDEEPEEAVDGVAEEPVPEGGAVVEAGAEEEVSEADAPEDPGAPEEVSVTEAEEEPPAELAEVLLPYSVEPTGPCGLSVDQAVVLDPEHLWLRGWVWDAEDAVERLDLVTPEGERLELLQDAYRFQRPDVAEVYRPTFGERAEGRHGFLCSLRLPERALLERRGDLVELVLHHGKRLRVGMPTLASEPFAARSELLRTLPEDQFLDLRLLQELIAPALEKLGPRCREQVSILRSFAFGDSAASPECSIIVPLFRRLDLVEHQLAQLADDPDLRRNELIFVVDSPQLEQQLEKMLFQLSRLYRMPLRGLVLSHNAGYTAAVNLGAGQARGRLLVLMHSDVFADRPGWLGSMAELYNSRDDVGVVGPKLLYEDRSLQHAGISFSRNLQPDGLWSDVPLFKGLPQNHPTASLSRAVPAVSGACLMIGRELFERLGGLRDVYVAGDLTDSDLCLRCLEEGFLTWYLPSVDLFHLEALSRFIGQGWQRNPWTDLYNRWLRNRRWGEEIEEVVERFAVERSPVGDELRG